MNCATCTFSHVNELDDGAFVLQCRRYPPQLFVWQGEVNQGWPQVTNEMVCGEWEGA